MTNRARRPRSYKFCSAEINLLLALTFWGGGVRNKSVLSITEFIVTDMFNYAIIIQLNLSKLVYKSQKAHLFRCGIEQFNNGIFP